MKLTAIIAAVLGGTLLLTGCGAGGTGKASEDPKSSAAEASAETESIVIPTDSASTVSETPEADTIGSFIEIGEYKGLEIEAGKDTPAETGMTVNLDFTGSINGEEFDGGSAQGYDLLLGSGSFIDNFEEQLTGHKAGEEVDVTVTFPSDYGSEELAGKKAVFACKINKVYVEAPDIAYSKFLDSCKVIKYPQSLLDEWTQSYLDMYGSYITLTKKNPSEKEILEAVGIDRKMLDSMVLGNVKEILACEAVMSAEGITEDSEEYKKPLLAFLEKNGLSSPEEAIQSGYTKTELKRIGHEKAVQEIMLRYSK